MKKRIALALAMAICLSLLCTVALADKVTVNFFHRWPNEPKNSYINSLIDEFEAANPISTSFPTAFSTIPTKRKSAFWFPRTRCRMCSSPGPACSARA